MKRIRECDDITQTSPSLKTQLARSGWVVSRGHSYRDFVALIDTLGNTINVAQIRVDRENRAKLSSDHAMPFHTDHPDAGYIAWYCHEQADIGGYSVLLDTRPIIERLPNEVIDSLRRIAVKIPAHPETTLETVPLLSNNGIYYASWLIELPEEPSLRVALDEFKAKLDSMDSEQLLLKPGDALIIDNRRILHGRSRFLEIRNTRHLTRHWVS